MVICLERVQTCIWPSRFHCHSLSLASVKSRLVLPFWYRLTRVVPEKGPLNGCVCVCVMQDHWVRSDGAQATREDLMMALSQLDYIMIKAQYAKETIDSRLEKMLHIL